MIEWVELLWKPEVQKTFGLFFLVVVVAILLFDRRQLVNELKEEQSYNRDLTREVVEALTKGSSTRDRMRDTLHELKQLIEFRLLGGVQ